MTFTKKIGGIFAKGLATTKVLTKKAGEKAGNLATKGAIKIESAQIKFEEGKLLERLGKDVYSRLMDMNESKVGRDDPQISGSLDAIKLLRSKIELKDKEYHAVGENAAAKA